MYEQHQGAVLKPLPTAKFSQSEFMAVNNRQKKCSHDTSGFDEDAGQIP